MATKIHPALTFWLSPVESVLPFASNGAQFFLQSASSAPNCPSRSPANPFSPAKWSRLQTKTSLKVAVRLMGARHTEWIVGFTEAEHYQVFLEGFEFGASAWFDRFDLVRRAGYETAFPITGGMARCPRNRIGNRSRGRLTRSRRLTPGYQMARVRNEGKIAVAKESLRFILPSPGCQNGNPCLDGFFKMILARSPEFRGIVVQIWILEILSFR